MGTHGLSSVCCATPTRQEEIAMTVSQSEEYAMVNRKVRAQALPQAGLLTAFSKVTVPKTRTRSTDDEGSSTTQGETDDFDLSEGGSSETPEDDVQDNMVREGFGIILEKFQPMVVPTPRLAFYGPKTLGLSVHTSSLKNAWPITQLRICLRHVESDTLWILNGEKMQWTVSDFNSASTAGAPVKLKAGHIGNAPVFQTTADVGGKGGTRFHSCVEAFNGNEWQWGDWCPVFTVPVTANE